MTGAFGRCKRSLPTAAAEPKPVEAEAQQPESSSNLQSFLQWALANGVEGVPGSDGSKTGLYTGEGGERGVVCLQAISKGETIMRLPLRLAITDQEEEGREEQAEDTTGVERQPWSVRLAGKLLQMLQQGDACPWKPYLAVLPRVVPSPLTTYSWDDVQAIQYPPMRRQVDHASWLASSACQQGNGAFTREQWDWALSVVHSRTFGAPGGSSTGGAGVRMLVPLVDMLNHAGDYITSPPGQMPPLVQAGDCVRWDLKAPVGPEGEWLMDLSATRDIAEGEELLLSYGERSNDEFHLHYGFVPARNPHDDITLFTDIEGAIDWWLSAYLPAGALPPQRLQLVINAAYNSAEQEDTSAQAAQAVLATVPRAEAAVIRAELERIKLSAGGMVDGRLLAAYRTLFEAAASQQQQQQEEPAAGTAARLGRDWQQHMRLAVARRSRELLKEMPTPLLQDLEQLAAEDTEQQQAHCWADVLKSYAAAVAAFEAEHGSLLDCEENERDTSAAAAGSAGPDAATSSGSTISEPALPDAGVDAEFARLLLQHAASDATALAPAAEERAGVGSSCILPVTYRAYKKMILTDAVLLCVA
ncbi:hypothetical protein D9Q98_007371 [Chlorella vulgaris]|uniref:SET domain-containing protein n=1 Tax=Chlorella vulgaris TaxID=3077 RepID=A0A9D4YVQ3_CHLVU|nr:hypothetical protein D9Q98_007371 [Chlorella vulgaris]